MGNRLWWTFVADGTLLDRRRFGQMFHYDLDNYRFVKIFFYLTNVDSTSAPHVCIKGSHRKKRLSYKLFRRGYYDKELADYYGSDKLLELYGEAGFGFAQDTSCFHKGTTSNSRERVFLFLQFAVNDSGVETDQRDPRRLKFIS